MATKQGLVKCRYSHCRHPDDLKDPSDMVVKNIRTYYHHDCYREKETIAQIVDYYSTKVDQRVSIAFLRKMINQVCFDKGVPADELLFGLKYTHESGKRINSPASLHYIASNKKIQHEYKKHLENTKIDMNVDDITVAKETTFKGNTNNRNKGFGSIF